MPSTARHLRRLAASALVAALAPLAACASDSPTGPGDGDGSGSGGTPSGSKVPTAVVGSWRYGTISPSNFWNDHTGQFSGNAYGMSDQYAFSADGTFKEYLYIYTQSYGCRTQVWVEMSGPVTFGAESFAKQVQAGRFKVSDTCSASRNYDRDMTAQERAERSKSFAYAVDPQGGALTILDARYPRVTDR